MARRRRTMPVGEENQVDRDVYYQITESLANPNEPLPDNVNINFYRAVTFQKNPAEEEQVFERGEDLEQ